MHWKETGGELGALGAHWWGMGRKGGSNWEPLRRQQGSTGREPEETGVTGMYWVGTRGYWEDLAGSGRHWESLGTMERK